MTEPRIPRPKERAEAIALKALRLGQGRHRLGRTTGYGEVDVNHHLDDLHRATVSLLIRGSVGYSFIIEIKIIGESPNPDELFESSDDGKEQET